MDYNNYFTDSVVKAIIPQIKDEDSCFLEKKNKYGQYSPKKVETFCEVLDTNTIFLYFNTKSDTQLKKSIDEFNSISDKNQSYISLSLNNKFNIKLYKNISDNFFCIGIKSSELPNPDVYYKLINLDQRFINHLVFSGLVKEGGIIEDEFEVVFRKSEKDECSLISIKDPYYPNLINELQEKLNIRSLGKKVTSKTIVPGKCYTNKHLVKFVYIGSITPDNWYSETHLFNSVDSYRLFIKQDSIDSEKTISEVLKDSSRNFANINLSFVDDLETDNILTMNNRDFILINAKTHISLYKNPDSNDKELISDVCLSDKKVRHEILKTRITNILDEYNKNCANNLNTESREQTINYYKSIVYNKIVFDYEHEFSLDDELRSFVSNLLIKSLIYCLFMTRYNNETAVNAEFVNASFDCYIDLAWFHNYEACNLARFGNIHNASDLIRVLNLADCNENSKVIMTDLVKIICDTLDNCNIYKDVQQRFKRANSTFNFKVRDFYRTFNDDEFINDVLGFRTTSLLNNVTKYTANNRDLKNSLYTAITEDLKNSGTKKAHKDASDLAKAFSDLIAESIVLKQISKYSSYSVYNSGSISKPCYVTKIYIQLDNFIKYLKDNNKMTGNIKSNLRDLSINNFIFKLYL